VLSKRDYNHKYRLEHLADFARRQEKYRNKHPEKIKQYYLTHYIPAPPKPLIIPIPSRLKLIYLLGDCCISCKIADRRVIQLDHKNGGGTQEYTKFGGHDLMIKYYLEHIDEAKQNLQVLCANCNLIKKYDNKEFGKRFMDNL